MQRAAWLRLAESRLLNAAIQGKLAAATNSQHSRRLGGGAAGGAVAQRGGAEAAAVGLGGAVSFQAEPLGGGRGGRNWQRP